MATVAEEFKSSLIKKDMIRKHRNIAQQESNKTLKNISNLGNQHGTDYENDDYCFSDEWARGEVATKKLFCGIHHKNPETVKKAIKEGANIRGLSRKGLTPLEVATKNGFHEIANIIRKNIQR